MTTRGEGLPYREGRCPNIELSCLVLSMNARTPPFSCSGTPARSPSPVHPRVREVRIGQGLGPLRGSSGSARLPKSTAANSTTGRTAMCIVVSDEELEEGRVQEGGWTLPLIPILLVATLALMYFFGWKALLIPLAAFVVISLGTFLYDRFPRRAYETTHFWFHSDQELSRLWELLVGTEHYSIDSEDVWEWWGVQVQEGECHYHLSVSRKHDDSSYPVHITVTHGREFTPKTREDLGRRFATALGTDVKAGSVECLDMGSGFAFTEEETFKVEARH